jgi:hypothetical protein
MMPKGSAIVLNASTNAHLGMPGRRCMARPKRAYHTAKTLSAELLERGIRVNDVSLARSRQRCCAMDPGKNPRNQRLDS